MESVQFYHRYHRRIETEQIYGEKWLRWAYETGLGRLGVEAVAKRAWFSRYYGWRMSSAKSHARIAPFVADYGLDASEFAEIDSFSSFNAFFRRTLVPAARPIDPDPLAIVFPADGRHLFIQRISESPGFYVKGQQFDLERFLGSSDLAANYRDGSAVFSRLCPVDYHRFHFAAAGLPGSAKLLNGPLYSVNPLALRRNLNYVAENKRVLTELETAEFGTVLIVEVGATNVGSIQQSYSPGIPVEKGAEKGWFEFGGSMVVTLLQPGRIEFADDLRENGAEGLEVYARMGDVMGRIQGSSFRPSNS